MIEREEQEALADELTRILQFTMNASGLPVPEDAYFAIFASQVRAFVRWQAARQEETGQTVAPADMANAARELHLFAQDVIDSVAAH